MKLFTVIFSLLLAGVVSAADCGAGQCQCEVIAGASAAEHDHEVFLCRDNPNGKDCRKICD
ncbi:hypothetical protein EJ02DRAFT_456781 [Clathrospora elynae]|uniref:Uncharacterized protein n=1 Tax=Clathrospora elynae TaxID=706981 RepID=A0A6A5SJH4_9PLEO|nr:hypothetical protein EJ02DRAFT_456781 [Clathrospora elynae]